MPTCEWIVPSQSERQATDVCGLSLFMLFAEFTTQLQKMSVVSVLLPERATPPGPRAAHQVLKDDVAPWNQLIWL